MRDVDHFPDVVMARQPKKPKAGAAPLRPFALFTTTNASAGQVRRRVRTAARAASSRPAACSVLFARPTTAGDGAIRGGARHRSVGMLLVPPGDVGGARGVGRRFQAGA
jgi:hypothetical protein